MSKITLTELHEDELADVSGGRSILPWPAPRPFTPKQIERLLEALAKWRSARGH